MHNQLISADGQSADVLAIYEKESEALEEIKNEILNELADLRHGKSVYDEHFPWWSKHLFGDISYAHEVVKKALRAASLVAAGATNGNAANKFADTMHDTLMDLLNFTVMWLAWRRYQRKEVPDADVSHRSGSEY